MNLKKAGECTLNILRKRAILKDFNKKQKDLVFMYRLFIDTDVFYFHYRTKHSERKFAETFQWFKKKV